jgi:hypothetical protein
MEVMVKKRQRRKLVETDKGELNFRVRGSEVPAEKIERWMKRKGISEDVVYAPSPAAGKRLNIACSIILTNTTRYARGAQCLDRFRVWLSSSEPSCFNNLSRNESIPVL